MSDFDLLKDIVVTVEYAQREWDNYTQVIHINNAMLLINKLAELEAANAKMRKCLEAIAEFHEVERAEAARGGRIASQTLHMNCRDFAREGLK